MVHPADQIIKDPVISADSAKANAQACYGALVLASVHASCSLNASLDCFHHKHPNNICLPTHPMAEL